MCQNISLAIIIHCPGNITICWCFSLRPNFRPSLYDNKSQDINPTEQSLVGNTYEVDAVSVGISLMGNYQNQVFVVGREFLLSKNLTNSLNRSRWNYYLYLLCTFNILLYLVVDRDYDNQYNALLAIPTRNSATDAYTDYS